MTTQNQPDWKPTNKMLAVGSSGVLAWVIVAIASSFGADIPPDTASAMATVISFIAGYLTRNEATQ